MFIALKVPLETSLSKCIYSQRDVRKRMQSEWIEEREFRGEKNESVRFSCRIGGLASSDKGYHRHIIDHSSREAAPVVACAG